MAQVKLRELVQFSKSKFQLDSSMGKAGKGENQVPSRPLRVFMVPIAFQRIPKSDRLACHYVLYSPALPTPSLTPVRHTISEVLNVWRMGLFVVGRGYRYVWDRVMMPNIYKHGNMHSTNPSEKLRKRIYDLSDNLVYRWMSSPEEDLLRLMNTHAQFIHFHRRMHVPIRKIEMVYPAVTTQAAKEHLVFDQTAAYIPPFQLDTGKLDKIEQNSSDMKQQVTFTLEHLSETVPHFKKQQKKSQYAFLATLPFYGFFSLALPDISNVVAGYFGLEKTTLDLKWLGDFIGLPLAYNIIRWFSYSRCVKSANLIKSVSESGFKLKETIEPEIERLEGLLDAETNEKRQTALKVQIAHLKQNLKESGIHYVPVEGNYAVFSKNVWKQKCFSMKMESGLEFVDDKSLSQFARTNAIKFPALHVYTRKAQEKLRMRLRMLSR